MLGLGSVIVTVLYWWTLTIALAAGGGGGAETAFYYGTSPPIAALAFFDRVVVDPAAVTPDEVEALASRSSALAYVSVGEVASTRSYANRVDPSWVLGENSDWNSRILDLSLPEVRAFLLEECERLRVAGFEGFFFDTLDSPIAAASDESHRTEQIAGLVALIVECRAAMPGTQIVVNRGFPVVDRCADSIDGVVAESLFRRWNPRSREFEKVPPKDRAWLEQQLERVQSEHRLPVTVIDYVPASRRTLAEETARAIEQCGFDAWVSVPELDIVGVGEWIPRPRRIVTVCTDDVDQVPYTSVHGLLAHVLDYYGLTTRYVGPATLPAHRLVGRAAGVVVWLDHDVRPTEALESWLRRQMADGVPVAFVGQLNEGWSSRFLDHLGFEAIGGAIERPVRIDRDSGFVGFEREVRARSRDLQLLRHRDEAAAVFRLADARNQGVDVVGFPAWGGFALDPYVLNTLFDEQRNWCLDPYRFVEKAFRIEPTPILDVTTENGSRLLLCHIDGDGAANRGEWPGGPHAIEVIRAEILEPYPVPTAVSLVEGETSETGVYRAQSPTLEAVATKIFALPHIELATHTYSHPFKWLKAERSPKNPRFRLPIPGYAVDMEREIVGSARYIESVAGGDAELGLVLWSGDALPSERVLRITREAGFLAMNGGNTQVTDASPSVANISGMSRPVGRELQIYAPIMNENVYTNLWRGPFHGFSQVIETFERTERPRRLKPLNIYYHFYSGSKQSSLRALRDVYDWAIAQHPLPIACATYVRMAHDFDTVTLAQRLDGSWGLRDFGTVRTVRYPEALGYPDFEHHPDLITLEDSPDGRRISFAAAGRRDLRFVSELARQPYARSINAEVIHWEREPGSLRLELRSSLPVRLVVPVPIEIVSSQAHDVSVNGDGDQVAEFEGRSVEVILRW